MMRSLPLLAAGLAAVRAQLQGLPQCGQTCVSNMLEIAVSDFGCNAQDLAGCACCNADFGYGIRDCSRQVCGDGSADYSSVIAYGSSYCAEAVSTCPSGTQATTVLATATGGAGAGSGSASASMSMPAITSGPLAGAVGGVSLVASDAYAVGDTTILAGGDGYTTDGTAYTALPSGGGVQIGNNGALTTYIPGMSGSASMSMSGGSGGALGAAAAQVSNVQGSPDAYVIGDNTISAGGNTYGNSGTTYSALPSGSGVQVIANGATTTVNPGMAGGAASSESSTVTVTAEPTNTGGGSGGAVGGGSNNGGGNGGNSGNNDSGSSSSSSSGGAGPIQTAAPALIGAAAMAILAL